MNAVHVPLFIKEDTKPLKIVDKAGYILNSNGKQQNVTVACMQPFKTSSSVGQN